MRAGHRGNIEMARRCYIDVADYPVRESPRAMRSTLVDAW